MRFGSKSLGFTVPFTRSGERPSGYSLPPVGGWSKSLPPFRTPPRWLFRTALVALAMIGASWLAVRKVPWFGPLLADTLRAAVGSGRVTRLEEVVADIEDRVQHAASDGKARSLSESTPAELMVLEPQAPRFPSAPLPKPTNVGALYPAVASAEDGVWQPVVARAGEPGAIHRTIVHPDAERAYAELFVFALNLSRVRVHAEPGSVEPKSEAAVPATGRPGIVPNSERARLIAAFNGGFKAEHGQFGMMVDGRVLLPAKPKSCTFGADSEGNVHIASWPVLAPRAAALSFWRQTPPCMVEDGVLHAGLRSADSKNWGATLEGKTVIRRSAAGLSRDGKTLFVGISNSTTARSLALGMQHVGAVQVAQLDVNFSYPRFLLYREDAQTGTLTARGAVKGLLYQPDEFLGRASPRDFFYVTAL